MNEGQEIVEEAELLKEAEELEKEAEEVRQELRILFNLGDREHNWKELYYERELQNNRLIVQIDKLQEENKQLKEEKANFKKILEEFRTDCMSLHLSKKDLILFNQYFRKLIKQLEEK